MDLSSAVVLGLVLVGLTSLAHTLVMGPNPRRLVAIICLMVSIAAVFLVGASDFAHQQVVLDKPLDTLNLWSQLLIAVLAAGIASATWEIGVKAISNIGQNNAPAATSVQPANLQQVATSPTPDPVVFNDPA